MEPTDRRPPLRIGVIGTGAIGSYVCRAIAQNPGWRLRLSGMAAHPESASAPRLARALGSVRVLRDPVDLATISDVVVEAASQEAVRQYAEDLLSRGVDLVVVSVGALAAPALLRRLEAAAMRSGAVVHVPSGAVGGLDALQSARLDRIDEVTLTTTKPPAALAIRPGSDDASDGGQHDRTRVVFSGSATRAVTEFPSNVNVAAAIGLASIGCDRVRVRVVSDPDVAVNTHRVHARGAFGELEVILRNAASPANPRTSHLAALSVLATLRRMASPIRIG